MRPHWRQPTRLPCLWDSPVKKTGVGCHFLLQCMKVKSESEVAQSCPTLSDPMDYSPPGSSVHGIFQARVLQWGATAFSIIYIGIVWWYFWNDRLLVIITFLKIYIYTHTHYILILDSYSILTNIPVYSLYFICPPHFIFRVSQDNRSEQVIIRLQKLVLNYNSFSSICEAFSKVT